MGKEVDPVLATLATGGLVLDITTGGIGDLTSIFKGAYRLSLQAAEQGVGGVLAAVIKEQAQSLLTGAITARQFIEGLGDRFKTFVDFAKPGTGCGFLGYSCWGIYDQAGIAYKNARNVTPDEALKQLDQDILDEDFVSLEVPEHARIDDIISCPIGSGAGNLLEASALTRADFVCPTDLIPREDITFVPTKGELAGKTVKYARPKSVSITISSPFPTADEAKDFGKVKESGSRLRNAGAQYDEFGKSIDDACHLIPKALKGKGTKNNIIPCEAGLNQRDLRAFEAAVKAEIVKLNGPVVFKVDLDYTNAVNPLRPAKIKYTVTKPDGTAIIIPGYTNPMTFDNFTARTITPF